MSHVTDPDVLRDEIAIAWICRPSDVPWARERVQWSRTTAS
jgi:hypothetical protein